MLPAPGTAALGRQCSKAAGGTESSGAADGIGQFIDQFKGRRLHPLDHHLGNPVPPLTTDGGGGIGVEERDADFSDRKSTRLNSSHWE